MMTSNNVTESSRRTISTPREAQEVVMHLAEVMDALLKIVEDETELVRAGRLEQASRLEPAKTDLARLYVADVARLKASVPYMEAHHRPLLKSLRQRHDSFHALLQVNLTVLATAHAVAEGIVRGASAEFSRNTAPNVYGASGRRSVPDVRHAKPIALSRSL
jgi:hypothetical protein